MASPLFVTVAIPTLGISPVLNSCLKALNAQLFRDFEVVIINNGPGPISPPVYVVSFPCRVLSPGSNIGFGAAINLAIRSTRAPFIATLNDDTEPDPEWLGELVSAMHSGPRIGMCASCIRLFESGRLDSAGMLICLDGSSKQRGQHESPGAFAGTEEVLFPSACAALYRRDLLDEVGLFDEDYFLYCEDTDLGLRAQWADWQCRYVARATVRHHYSHTAGAFSPLKALFVERNRIWVALKNFPAVMLPMVPVMSCVRYLWQLTTVRAGRGAASEFMRSGNTLLGASAILARAHWETLLHLPSLLRKRTAVRRKRKLGSLEFAFLLYRHRITAKAIART